MCHCEDCRTRPLADRWHNIELEDPKRVARWAQEMRDAFAAGPSINRTAQIQMNQTREFNSHTSQLELEM